MSMLALISLSLKNSANDGPGRRREQQAAPRALVVRPRCREHVPESQGLVPRSGNDRRTVGTHSQVQHAVCVPREGGHLGHGGVPPHDNLVEGVPVGRDELVAIAGPGEVAHLTSGVDAVEGGAAEGVPEADAPIGRTTPGSQESVLVGTPRDRLDGGGVLGEAVDGTAGVILDVPHEELVVVPAGRQVGRGRLVRGPLQTAHLLLVAGEAGRVGSAGPHVPQVNHTVPAAGGEGGAGPGEGTDAGAVAGHGTDRAALDGIPDLDLAAVGTDGEVGASLGPGYGRDDVVVLGEVAQLGDLGGARGPEVDARAEADCQNIQGRPIHEVQVEIILERRSVEHLERDLGYPPLPLLGPTRLGRQSPSRGAPHRTQVERVDHVRHAGVVPSQATAPRGAGSISHSRRGLDDFAEHSPAIRLPRTLIAEEVVGRRGSLPERSGGSVGAG
mmetsp:Transcript_45852/g.139263  ORF Transcript_45852/g.139263 Transcript_45852/m.139263 type:complete len:444 (+) Transcript_45852:221-1552(+)